MLEVDSSAGETLNSAKRSDASQRVQDFEDTRLTTTMATAATVYDHRRGDVYLPEQPRNLHTMRHTQQRYAMEQHHHHHHRHLPRGSASVSSGPLLARRERFFKAPDDDGETSSASEESTASYPSPAAGTAPLAINYKHAAEPSTTFSLPPSKRFRTIHFQEQKQVQKKSTSPRHWLPVPSGEAIVAGGGQQQHQHQQRQLPRLAALETLLSPHTYQQNESHHQQQQQRSSHQNEACRPTTRTLGNGAKKRCVQPPLSMPPFSASRASPPGPRSVTSSTSSSPTCSPGLRSASPPSNLHNSGRYHHGLPVPGCLQGSAGQVGSPSHRMVNQQQEQRWLLGTTAHPDLGRQSPRFGTELRGNNISNNHINSVIAATTSWDRTAPLPASPWPKPAGGQQTTVSYSNRMVEPTSFGSFPSASYGGREAAWSQPHEHGRQTQQHFEVVQEPYDIAAAPSSSSSSSSSSRTPSPVSSAFHGHEQHLSRQQQQQQQQQHSSERKMPWNPPAVLDDDRSASSGRGDAHGGKGRGKWDQEVREDASGSVGKQILQRYLSHLYPKASREVWSHDEEEVLWRAQKEYGNAWCYISGLLPGRSENAVKNHWYTQMRMFIGQRGSNPSSSKPCPPSAKGGAAKAAGGKDGSRQPRRKYDDAKADEPMQQQQQHRTNAPTPPTAPAAAPLPAPTPTAFAEAESHGASEENQARADAVAALGMLFSQGSGGSGTAASSSAAENNRR